MLKFHYPVSILCYDGDNSGDPAAAAAAAGETNTGNSDGSSDRTFTQVELNKILADDKRKHQEKYGQLEQSYQDLLSNQNISEEQRKKLEERLEDVQASLRTKEQQAEYERKQSETKYEDQLKTAETRANHWEGLYKQETVVRSLQDAATGADAFNPNQIVGLLKPMTELKDIEGKLAPMIDFPDIDEKTGAEITTLRTPAEAVKRMKELPKVYGNLFKSNVVSGVGAGQANTGTGDNLDYANMSPEDYRKNRAAIRNRVGRS